MDILIFRVIIIIIQIFMIFIFSSLELLKDM